MKHKQHRFKRPHKKVASIDGIIPSSGRLGERPAPAYQPDKSAASPSLGDFRRRSDGFHSSRSSGAALKAPVVGSSETPEREESAKLKDEPIILDGDDIGTKDKKAKRSKHPRARKVIKRAVLAVLAIAVATTAFLGWKFEHNLAKIFHGNVFGLLHHTTLKGESTGRVNILLAGNSSDDKGHQGAQLTDSIMIASLDVRHNTGYILSIPRDLWVEYGTASCAFGNSGKINAVYECGQLTKFNEPGYPKGGMGLLEKDLNKYLGVNINYYALINYSALRDSVNAVGGVGFTVRSQDSCGLYDGNIDYTNHQPLVKLSNGHHVLKGQQALDLARARGDPPYQSCGFERGDFTRTQNQRQLLLSLKGKILSLGVLSNPVKISSLLDVMGKNVQTDFHVDEIKRLYDLNKKIPNSSIQSIGLADPKVNLVKTGSVGNQSVVIPTAGAGNFSQIDAYIKKITSDDPVVKEGASAVILNGSGVNGLAAKTAAALAAKGLDVKAEATDTLHKTSVVIYLNNTKPATKAYLEKKFGVTATSSLTAHPEAKYYSADFVIILGENAKGIQ